jgi:hypothetical protein
MSTQGFYGYKLNNEIKGIQLRHDAYPSHAGKEIVGLIQEYSDAEIKSLWLGQIVLLDDFSINDFENLDIDELRQESDKIFSVKPRKLNLLSKIFDSLSRTKTKEHYFVDGYDFYKRGIFCSYAYILDFDNLELSVYGCYNATADTGLENWFENDLDGKPFYMNKLISTKFSDIRTGKLATILDIIKEKEDEKDKLIYEEAERKYKEKHKIK